jgi:hypothetical protein
MCNDEPASILLERIRADRAFFFLLPALGA